MSPLSVIYSCICVSFVSSGISNELQTLGGHQGVSLTSPCAAAAYGGRVVGSTQGGPLWGPLGGPPQGDGKTALVDPSLQCLGFSLRAATAAARQTLSLIKEKILQESDLVFRGTARYSAAAAVAVAGVLLLWL